jgi:hypothetical protein
MQTQITLRGYLVGSIWWPVGAECYKHLTYDVTREDSRFTEPGTLRDHVLRATNDGDFQCATIACGELIAERREIKDGRERIVRRSFPLSRFPSVADCLHPEGDAWWPPSDFDDE